MFVGRVREMALLEAAATSGAPRIVAASSAVVEAGWPDGAMMDAAMWLS